MRSIRTKSLSFLLIACLLIGIASIINVDSTYAASKKIHLKKASISLNIGKTYQQKLIDKKGKTIKATKVKWKSAKTSVAKINKKGKITAVKAGTAKMTAKYKGKTYKFTVKVKDPKKYTSKDEVAILGYLYHAANWAKYLLDDYDIWNSDSFSPYSSAISDIKSDVKEIKEWLIEAQKITKKKYPRYCMSSDAIDEGFDTWDDMLKQTINTCTYIQNADVDDMSISETYSFAAKILFVCKAANIAYIEVYEYK